MCGIAGDLTWSARANREAVDAMVSGIAHRGPVTAAFGRPRTASAFFGHARLSIIDLSPAGHQPMLDPFAGNAIVFNGEIYNFQTLRKGCESAGDVFKSHSDTEVIDTEVILALYRRHGIDCLTFLRGMFALAIWDERRQQLFLARERVGKKPITRSRKLGRRSAPNCIRFYRDPSVDNGMDSKALKLYLQCQFIPAPWNHLSRHSQAAAGPLRRL